MSDHSSYPFTNKLIGETSPYLLQHAHNPVNWYPWGDEALTLAKTLQKPILVSIGYSACHWCHVMEKESFEHEPTATIMNSHFINIKIDREERPDLDHIYMDAVQAMTGSGGWPLNVFLTPEGKPFYGGTYFPPQKAYNRPSWQDVLMGVSEAFNNRRHEIDAQAENLTEHIIQSNSFGFSSDHEGVIFSDTMTADIVSAIMKTADPDWGGFGKAPKFPQTQIIKFLLRNYHETQNEAALRQGLLSLDKMIDGGIYDQVGGGFARYSTDAEWLVPHFEKMLYDNALLITVMAEAYQVTGKDRYRDAIRETIGFLEAEMLSEEGGFFSALDADSEGEEGKFYVWDQQEVEDLLGDDAPLFCQFYDITAEGNWEGKNILWIRKGIAEFSKTAGIPTGELQRLLQEGKQKLLQQRNKRTRPQLDDKVILGWNALANTALCHAFAATGHLPYKELAVRNMDFLLEKFKDGNGGYFHTYKNNRSKYPAFLDDYAFLIQALIQLQEITGNREYLLTAMEIANYVLNNFEETGTGYFFYTHKDQEDVIVRKKEVYDGAVPSGNSVMAYNLYQLSNYFGKDDLKDRALRIIKSLLNAIIKYPVSFGNWACLLQEIVYGTKEIAVVGKDPENIYDQVLGLYIPHKIIMCSTEANNQFPLLSDKKGGGSVKIYLCRDYTCLQPVSDFDDFKALLAKNKPE
ncbi:MAG: DUF255 domain-containing protein [Terrimonas sp.]|nr:DUF255 domain-containing protein [Terrimonas sp.]